MMATQPLCDVRVPPGRRGESLSMTLTYDASSTSPRGAIVASPLPFLGGDMDNNVVRLLARTFARRGVPALRYDYRSVGDSHDVVRGEARYDTWRRVEESGDRAAVIADADEALRRSRRLFEPALLAGYSFGCWTATRTAERLGAPVPMVLVAPPLAHVDITDVRTHDAPVLLVFAGDDALSPTPTRVKLSECFPSANVSVIDGADHFFRDHEREFTVIVDEFVSQHVEAEV